MKIKKDFKIANICSMGLIVLALLVGYFFLKPTNASKNEDVASQISYQSTLNASPYIPDNLQFADENIPIATYWVRENLDKELIIASYQHSTTMLSLKRSKRFFPMIEKILAEESVPLDFKYLCVAESNLQNVISPAKATGYWQFLESTGKHYGLEINNEVDERYHLEKSTRAACQYLKESKQRLGSWTLAAAAYNMGETNLKKNIELQQTNQYWELLLNQETARYLYRIIAYKLIFENPTRYYFSLEANDYYYPIPCDEVNVDTTIADLYLFANKQNITYRELKEHNPWLRNSSLTVKHKKYLLKIPQKSSFNYKDLLPKE